MATYHYVACHDCKVVGMLPKSDYPQSFAEEWKINFGHIGHNVECADEFNEEFDARVQGRKITGYTYYGPTTEKFEESYKNVTSQTL